MPSICRRVDDAVLPQGGSSASTKPGALESVETPTQQPRPSGSMLEQHRPTPLLVPGARTDRTEAQVLKNLCGVWTERYVKSDLTARDKYLESSGWSYFGRTLVRSVSSLPNVCKCVHGETEFSGMSECRKANGLA
jgi:hypothetical protein